MSPLRLRLLAGLAGLAGLAPSQAAAAPGCPGGEIKSRVLYSTGDTLEYGIFDRMGRFFYSDSSSGSVMRIDRLGDKPRRLAAVAGPGAMVFAPDGSIIMGTGDALQNGATGDSNPSSGLVRLNPSSGATRSYATGLGMANGVAMGPDSAVYATNDLGYDVDRVLHGKVMHPWARVYSTNGIIVSPDNRYVYVSQTFAPAAIQRISIADPSQVTPYATAGPMDYPAGLDDMASDSQGNLYAAANGAGQVWKISSGGVICLLASGFRQPSAVNFGVGANVRNLYVVAFDGTISELPNVLPAQTGKSPTRHDRMPSHQRARHRRHRVRHRRGPTCRDVDRDRDCD